MLKLLEITGIPGTRADSSIATCPGKPFFLQAEFIRKYWKMSELPEDKLSCCISFAAKIQSEPRYRLLAWHLYRYMTLTPMELIENEALPDIIDGLGVESGMLYLLIGLSFIPSFIARAERENFPVSYAEAGAKRLGSTTVFFAQKYNGAFGLRGRTLLFQKHYMETATWRIGRFDFVIRQADDTVPEIYRNGSNIIAFCPDGMPLTAGRNRAASDAETVRQTRLICHGNTVTGTPVDFRTGLAESTEMTLDLNAGWERAAGSGDWTLFFHIPGGGGMKPELCRESFREAWEFFQKYVPDKEFRLIWSASWIFNPAWREMLPESNLAKLIRRGRLYP